jgi:hypothetical protein
MAADADRSDAGLNAGHIEWDVDGVAPAPRDAR